MDLRGLAQRVLTAALVTALWLPPAVAAAATFSTPTPQDNPHLVVYEGTEGPGVGRHIVLIAGDHEYRSEELLPALGRLLAKHLGFKSSVFFTLDDDGFIEPASDGRSRSRST